MTASTNIDGAEDGSREPSTRPPALLFTGAGARRSAVAWVVVGTIGLLAYRPIFYWISHAYVLVITLWAAVGLVLAIRLGNRLLGARATLGTGLAFAIVPLFVVVLAVASEPIANVGDGIFTRAYFAMNHSHYDDVIAEFDPDEPPCGTGWDRSCRTSGGTVFRYDVGPPLRLAFPRPGGPTDNWIGVVHDPSGVIGDASPRQPRSFIGFDAPAIGCSRLGDHYFECRFQ